MVLLLQHLFVAAKAGVHVLHPADVLRGQILQHLAEDRCQRRRVVSGPVVVKLWQFQIFVHRIQLVVAQARIQRLRHGKAVDVGVAEFHPRPPGRRLQDGNVEAVGVVGHQHPVAREVQKLLQGRIRVWRTGHHAVVDAGQLHHLGRDGHGRVHKGVERLGDLPVFHSNGADLDELVHLGVQAGGLGVKHHKAAAQRAAGPLAVHNGDHIVHKIGLAAVDQLEVRVLFADVVGGQHGLGVALAHAVVGDGNGLVAHAVRQLHDLARVAEAVHAGELGVQVQLHPLFGGVVLPLLALHDQHIVGVHHIVPLVFVKGAVALDHQRGAGLQALPLAAVLPFLGADLQVHRAGVVGDGNGVNLAEVALHLAGEHLAPHRHLAALAADVLQRLQGLRLEELAVEHLHRLVRQIQAGNLQGRRLLLFHKGCHRHLLLNVLFPCLIAERLLHGQLHGGQHPRAVLDALGQLVAKADALQNVQACAQMNGQLAALQVHPAFIQKAVDRQPLLLQFLDQVHHGGRRDLPKGEQAVHGDFKPRKRRGKRQGQLLAQGAGQRHGALQIDVDLLALAHQLHPVHKHLGKACSKGRVLPKLGPKGRHQRLHRLVLLSFVLCISLIVAFAKSLQKPAMQPRSKNVRPFAAALPLEWPKGRQRPAGQQCPGAFLWFVFGIRRRPFPIFGIDRQERLSPGGTPRPPADPQCRPAASGCVRP